MESVSPMDEIQPLIWSPVDVYPEGERGNVTFTLEGGEKG